MKNVSLGLGLCAALAGAFSCVFPGIVLAQSAAPSFGVEEVVVTAQRRSEVLSRVPASISAFTTERMEQLNVKDFSDLVRFTPGVTLDEHSGTISVRGVNSDAGDATTGVYIDDTPIQLRSLGFGSDNTLPAVFDLERVEVLRGPQGTLFGAGSEGGTIRYITPQPSLTDYSVYGKTEFSSTRYGSPNYEAGIAVGGPIVDNQLGFRVSGWWRHDGGYIDQINYLTGAVTDKNTNWTDNLAFHGAMGWEPNGNLTVTPSIFFQNRRTHNDDEWWTALSNPNDGRYITGTPELMGNHDRFVLPALKIDYNLGDVELISNTSYFDRHQEVQDYSGTLYDLSYFQQAVDYGLLPDFETECTGGICGVIAKRIENDPDYVGPPLLLPTGPNLPGLGGIPPFGFYKARNVVTNEQQNWTQEARLQSTDTDSVLSWILGAFYTHQDQLSIEEINDPQLPALTEYLWGDTVENVWGVGLLPNGDDYINNTQGHEWQAALFGNATIKILEDLKLQVGARVAKTHFDFTNFADGAQNGGFTGPDSGKKDETPFTPMTSLTWQITPDNMVYGTIAKGYRIGGANPLFPIIFCNEISVEPTSYNSDTVVSYEVGTKDKVTDRLQLSGSVFYLEWNNIQQSVTLPSCGFRFTTNVGTAVSQGFDLEGEWLATDHLDFNFSLGYVDSHYTSTSVAAGLVQAINGDKLPGSPWNFSIGAQYTAPVMGYESFVRLDYEFASRETGLTPERDSLTTLFDPGLVAEPETNVLSIRAGTTIDRFSVSLFADNLLNSHPRLHLTHQDSGTLLFEATTLRPRTVGLTAAYRY
ncbi:MAG: TonB-dependent receptor [Alphaproteobacteria bacterium]|nr:TonB-dependent receptor [Alphaproteobacteria bacterium]